MVFHGQSSNDHDERNCGNLHKYIGKITEFHHQQKQTSANDTGRSINFFSEDQRNPVQKNISDNPAKTTGNRTKRQTDYRVQISIQTLLNTDYGEKSQT